MISCPVIGRLANPHRREQAMIEEPKSDVVVDDILHRDISDEALERAAGIDSARVFTIAFCTQEWNYCYPS
jgi:hypothetical protein